MSGFDIVFLLFAAITVGSAALVVFSKRITHAAFALMFSLFGVAGLYVFLSADFLAAVQIIIYIGGILVLLLFGVLLTVKISSITITTQSTQRIWGAIAGTGLFILVLTIIIRADWFIPEKDPGDIYFTQSRQIGERLMTEYLLPFEIASVLLLAALIGAMFMIRSEDK